VRLSVRSSKGFFVRSLAADIGEALGCGAHLTALRRTQSGPFTLAQSMPLADVVAQGPAVASRLVGLSDALSDIPELKIGRGRADAHRPASHRRTDGHAARHRRRGEGSAGVPARADLIRVVALRRLRASSHFQLARLWSDASHLRYLFEHEDRHLAPAARRG
jgi:tRNA pseudouridine55 synthase